MIETSNRNYDSYKFNYYFLENISYYIDCLSSSFLVNSFIRSRNGKFLDQFHKILWVVLDLLVSADKSLTENNEAAFIACSSMANEYMLKFSLVFSEYKKDGGEVIIDTLFHDWKDISIWKLPKKAIDNINSEILEKLNINKNISMNHLINDFKHLNNISVIHFHNAFAKGDGNNIDENGAWVDDNAYHFGIMEILFETLLIVLLNCYSHHPEQLTSSDYIDHLECFIKPPKNSQYIAAPWFVQYIEEEDPNLKKILFNGKYLKCFSLEK